MDSLNWKLSHVPQIKWKCPPKFVPRRDWQMAAGEESKEAETQRHREMRVIEAVYPCPSDIPHSPYQPMDVQEVDLDDSLVPVIPLTAIEEEGAVNVQSHMTGPQNVSLRSSPYLRVNMQEVNLDDSRIPCIHVTANKEGAVGLRSDMAALENASIDSRSEFLAQILASDNHNKVQPNPPKPSPIKKPACEMLSGSQADVVAAATVAFTAIMKSKELGSLIDTDLLIKLLNDPKMIEKLMNEQRTPAVPKAELAPHSKLDPAEEVFAKDGVQAKTRNIADYVLKPNPDAKALPCLKPDPGTERLIHKQRATTKAGANVVSGSKPVTDWVASPSFSPNPVVKELIDEIGVCLDAGNTALSAGKIATSRLPQTSLPGYQVDLEKIKRMIDEYGMLKCRETDPISMLLPSALQVPSLSTELNSVIPARMDFHPPPNNGENGLQLQALSPGPVSHNLNMGTNMRQPDLEPKSQAALNLPMKAASPNIGPMPSFSTVAAPPLKDVNYIKNLIRQHGETRESKNSYTPPTCKFHLLDPQSAPSFKPNDLAYKFQKPCMYFNSSRGCRNGSNCPYRHDTVKSLYPGRVPEAPDAKRMRLGGEINGRT
ncbi:hypothetical protein NMG60_11007878 [Bertholletia excelsa]